MEKFRLKLKGDRGIWFLVIIFAMISILAVFSSSSYLANSKGVEKTVIFLDQAKSVLFGFLALFVCYVIPVKVYRKLSFIIFGGSVMMLLMLFIPGLRDVKNGAVRGIKLFGHTVQVFEFVKIGIILYLAKAIEMWKEDVRDIRQFALKIFLPIGGICFLVMFNSFSSALLIGIISYIILFVMDVDWKNVTLSLLAVAAFAGLLFGIYHVFFAGKPHEGQGGVARVFNRFETVESRIDEFLHGEQVDIADMSPAELDKMKDDKRQHEYAKTAISEGGLFGKGPGKSTRRYSLSMAFSDFIYAFIVEEYGLLGGVFVIFLYLVFLFRCIRLMLRCGQPFSGSLIAGLAFLITTQAFLHILVNVRILPITGHTLPLISHGGTAYLVLGGAFGIILSMSRQLDKRDEKQAALAAENMNDEEQSEDNY